MEWRNKRERWRWLMFWKCEVSKSTFLAPSEVKGQDILGPSILTGNVLPLPTLSTSTGEEKSAYKKKDRKSVRRLRWMKCEVCGPLGLAVSRGSDWGERTLNKTLRNNTQVFFLLFPLYKELETNLCFQEWEKKMKTFFYLQFSPTLHGCFQWLFIPTRMMTEGAGQRRQQGPSSAGL